MASKGINFHHIALDVKDLESSVRFYKDAFGLKEYARWNFGDKEICMLSFDNNTFIELHSGKDPHRNDGIIWHFSISPKDIDKTYKKAISKGAKSDRAPFNFTINAKPRIIIVRIAWLIGPNGEHIELFSEQN
jgi:predicted enzyme related to lactoylglutathione lyase